MQYVWPVIISYLLGSIIFSFVVGKLLKGVDVRKHGSGNAGATNTLRVLGKGPGVAVLLLDIAKGVLAVWIGKWAGHGELLVPVLCGIAVIIGHNWPIYFGFKGGKGVATTIGVAATLAFVPTLIAGIAAIIIIALTRYVSLGSLLLALLLPILLLVMSRPVELVWAGVFICALAYIRHRSNIVKLVQGTESKLGRKR